MRSTAVALLSLEHWDDVWRRNQHLASRLVTSGWATSLTFLTPPTPGLRTRAERWSPMPGITVVTPPLVVPRRYGGHAVLTSWLRRTTADADVLWVNDPVAGAGLRPGPRPIVYDVTDDWRSMPQAAGDLRRIVAAEDKLARSARTVVCSNVLRDRWRERYGIEAVLVPNGVDTAAIRNAEPRAMTGAGPHAVYVGTLHENRVDLRLLDELAERWPGTLHLVGPNGLPAAFVARLAVRGVDIVGPVPSADVPTWLNGADVLVCPHVVDDFTLSLDAIKSHEYLATERPVVATPSSGFQSLTAEGLSVVPAPVFVETAVAAARAPKVSRAVAVDWAERTASFAAVLRPA